MIVGGDSKRMAEAIVSRIGNEEDMKEQNAEAFSERAADPESEPIDEGTMTAAEEMLSAFEAKDAAGFASALISFLEMQGGPSREEG